MEVVTVVVAVSVVVVVVVTRWRAYSGAPVISNRFTLIIVLTKFKRKHICCCCLNFNLKYTKFKLNRKEGSKEGTEVTTLGFFKILNRTYCFYYNSKYETNQRLWKYNEQKISDFNTKGLTKALTGTSYHCLPNNFLQWYKQQQCQIKIKNL